MNTNTDLDLFEGVRLLCSAVEQLAMDAERRSGTVEAQRAMGLVHRARRVLDALAATAIEKAG